MPPDFSIIIPAHNEENSLKGTISSLEKVLSDYNFEIVVVNDHSGDRTVKVVRELTKKYPNVRLVNNRNKKGFATTLIAGFRQARGEFLIPVMADGCDDPNTIKEMYRKVLSPPLEGGEGKGGGTGYDLICASRYCKGGKRVGGPKLKGFFSESVGRTLHFLIKIPTTDVANAFKLYRKGALQKIKIKNSGFAISMEITLKMYFRGYKISEIPTCWKGRKEGKSKFQVLKIAPLYLKWYLWALMKRAKLL